MQRRRNGQIVGVKHNTKTGEGNRHVTIVERRVTLDQIVKQNHNNQEMIQEGTMVTRGNPLMEHVIIVERRAINNPNVGLG